MFCSKRVRHLAGPHLGWGPRWNRSAAETPAAPAEGAVTQHTTQKSESCICSFAVESSAVVKKQRGGSPVCLGQMEREEAQTEGAKSPTFTLSLIREEQLMNRGLKVDEPQKQLLHERQSAVSVSESFCTQLSSQLSNQIHDPSAQLIRCFTD
ncbi:hypothetical protein SRHO_G00118080 [Serrasalmus rhombeus]